MHSPRYEDLWINVPLDAHLLLLAFKVLCVRCFVLVITNSYILTSAVSSPFTAEIENLNTKG